MHGSAQRVSVDEVVSGVFANDGDGGMHGTAQRDVFDGVMFSFADATIASQSMSIGGSGVGGTAGYFARHSNSFAHSSGWCCLKWLRANSCRCSFVRPVSAGFFFLFLFFFFFLRRRFFLGSGLGLSVGASRGRDVVSAFFWSVGGGCSATRLGRFLPTFLAAARFRFSPHLRFFIAAVGLLARDR